MPLRAPATGEAGERVAADDEVSAAPGSLVQRARACRRCSSGLRARTSPSQAAKPRVAGGREATMAKRSAPRTRLRPVRCGARGDEQHARRGARASRAFSAARRWPKWMGSNVPPNRPSLTPSPPRPRRRAGARSTCSSSARRSSGEAGAAHRGDRQHREAQRARRRAPARGSGSASASTASRLRGRHQLRPLERARGSTARPPRAPPARSATGSRPLSARGVHDVQQHRACARRGAGTGGRGRRPRARPR